MNERRGISWSQGQVLGLAFGLLLVAVIFHLTLARLGKPLYRDIHLGTALEYARTRIDLLHPIIVGFTANGSPTPQELPLWQAAVALAFKLCGTWYGWANVVSLILFSTCLFPLHQIAALYGGARCAAWTLVFFLAQPLIFLYGGLASTDGFSLAGAIWFLYFAVKLLRTPGLGWWLLTVLAGAVAAVSKFPFFLATGLAVFFLTVAFYRNSAIRWLLMGSAAVLMGGVFLAWTWHVNRCYALAEFPYVNLTSSTPEMKFWFFGDWHYRLSPANWVRGGWRFLNACFGSLALAGVFAGALLFVRQHALPKFWLLGGVLTTLVFTHVVLHHSHYYLMFTPAIALIWAQAAAEWEKRAGFGNRWQARLGLAVLAGALGLSVLQGLLALRLVLALDPYPQRMAALIAGNTTASDKLLIEGGDWGGNELILAGRRGLSIWDPGFLEKPENCRRLKELGYTKLVMISETPLLVAVKMTNPGETAEPRTTWQKHLTPLVEPWPTVYRSEDLLIKELP